ncbi:MAG: alpha/beta fold hydrolase [bacterium]|nr:alpha/beta fold hydrolase [bacterium]
MEKPIVFKSQDYFLIGVLHHPCGIKAGKKFPGVILCHGFSGNKSESHFIFTRLARNLAEAGIGCLRFDFMGSGDSAGYFEDMSLETEIHDAENALKYLAKQPFIDEKNLGILGLSMGAIPAVAAATKYKFKALCLWSPVAFPQEIERKILTRKLRKILDEKSKVYLTGYGLRIGKMFIESLYKIKPITMAEKFCGHSLIIHSKDDASIDVSHALSYYNAFHRCATSKKLIILEKGGHTFVLEDSERTVLKQTTEFFRQILFTL